MHVIFKYFFLGLLILIFSFLHFLGSLHIIAGQFEPETPLGGTKGMEIIIDDFLVNDDTISLHNQLKPTVAQNLSGNFVIAWKDCRKDYLGDIYAQRFNSWGMPVDYNFEVNSNIESAFQDDPAVGIDSPGNFVITWEDGRYGQSDIYAQRYDSSGTSLGFNFRVNNDAGDFGQYSPDIAMDYWGNFVITWTDYRNGNADIYAQRYSSSGKSLSGNFKVNDDTGITYQEYPAVAIDGHGNFIITWQDYRNRDWDIYAQRYDSSGTPIDGNFKINHDTGESYQKSPAIASDFSGNFIITWRDEREGNSDIYAQRYDSSAIPLDSNFKVSDDAGYSYQGYPSVSLEFMGDFIITWTDYRNGNRDIYAQRYGFSGTPAGPNFKINDDTGNAYQEHPAVAIDSCGNFVLTWQDLRKGNYDIFAQAFDSNGVPVDFNFIVNDDFVATDQGYPVIEVDHYGNFTLAWQDYRNGNWNIYAQRCGPSGTFLGSNFKVNNDTGTAHQKYPAMAVDSYSNIILTWQDYRNGDWEIYAQRFNSSGSPLGSNFKVDSLGGTSPAVAIDGAGNFVITWEDGNIYAQRFNSSGVPIGVNFKVGVYGSAHPDIAMDYSGNFVITWTDYRNGSYDPDIYVRRYDSEDIPLGSDFKVNDDTVYNYQREPAIALDNTGNFVITWQDYRNGDWDIYAQRYDSSGIPIGSNFKIVHDIGTSYQWSPKVVIAEDGSFTITWHDYRNINPDIYAQRYDSSGAPLGDNYLVTNPQFATFDQVNSDVSSSGSNLYFTWMDNRRGNWDIYAKVVDLTWTEVEEDLHADLPVYFELSQNYPNPFNHATTIHFSLRIQGSRFNEPIRTTLVVYNILGQKVKTLVNEEMLPGNYQQIWDGKDEKEKIVSSGVYFYRLKAGEFVKTKRMVFLK